MSDRDAALDDTIQRTAAILAEALVRLLFPESTRRQVDLPEIESAHGTAG